MQRLGVYIVFSVLAVVHSQDDFKKCIDANLMKKHCCALEILDEKQSSVKECENGDAPDSCATVMCVAEKKGFVSNGTLDMVRIQNAIEEDLGEYEEMVDSIEERCINGDLEKYGQPEHCKIIKLSRCMSLNIHIHCPEWREDNGCDEVKKTMEECENMLK